MPMPNLESSNDRLSLQPSRAHFVAWYSELKGKADGGGHDEEPGPALAEVGEERLRRPDDAEQVGVDLLDDLGVAGRLERTGEGVSGVVEDDVHRPELERTRRGRLDLVGLGDVEREQGHPRDPGQVLLPIGVAHRRDHAPALLREEERRRLAQPGRAPRHEDGLVGRHVVSSVLR
jgi:hypothetical protein